MADLDLLGGHVDDAFNRLIDLVRRTTEADRDAARTHLIGLFGAVGNEDPRVQRARRDLASALFWSDASRVLTTGIRGPVRQTLRR